jgi:myosin heavy subunit
MRDLLLKKAQPLLEAFVDGILEEEKAVKRRIKEYDDLISATEKEKRDAQGQKDEWSRRLDVINAEHKENTARLASKEAKLQQQLTEAEKLKNEATFKVNEAEEIRRDAVVERDLATQAKKTVKDKITAYEKRIEGLKSDDMKLSDREKQINNKEREVDIKMKAALDFEKKNLKKEQELAEYELDLQVKSKEIKFEYKRLKLDAK